MLYHHSTVYGNPTSQPYVLVEQAIHIVESVLGTFHALISLELVLPSGLSCRVFKKYIQMALFAGCIWVLNYDHSIYSGNPSLVFFNVFFAVEPIGGRHGSGEISESGAKLRNIPHLKSCEYMGLV